MFNVNKTDGVITTIEQTKTVIEKNHIFKNVEKHAKIDMRNVDPTSELVGFVCSCAVNGVDTECIITKDQVVYLPKELKGSGFFHRFEDIQIKEAKISLFNKEGNPMDLINYAAREMGFVKRSNIHRLGYTTPGYRERKLKSVV